ncbi:MAG: sigma-70 family RNA polymerase sigma factor [Bacteroidales bacterium]|nr:sigma-70 family RNA polymerase sigma factor [Bacteroidales bacterium]
MTEIMTEQQLARLCCEGDRRAQGELYTRYAARLLALCRRYCQDPDDAHDLMQDAVIRAVEKMDGFTFRGQGSLYAWMSRIAVNMAVSRLRRNKFLHISIDRAADMDIPDPPPEEVREIPKEVMLDMVAGLPPVRRAVFNMYCIDGYSHKDIADMLGITEKGSASNLAKARNQLKQQITVYLKEKE